MKRLIPFTFILLMVLALGIATQAQPAQPQAHLGKETPETTVYLEPMAQTLIPSDYVTVAVKVADVEGLFGLKLQIHFDTQIVTVSDANEAQQGVQILPGDFIVPFFQQENDADNALGVIDFEGIMDVTAGARPVSGSGTLAIVTFQGVGLGSTKIELATVQLAPQGTQEIPSQIGPPAHIYVLDKELSQKIYLPLLLRNG